MGPTAAGRLDWFGLVVITYILSRMGGPGLSTERGGEGRVASFCNTEVCENNNVQQIISQT